MWRVFRQVGRSMGCLGNRSVIDGIFDLLCQCWTDHRLSMSFKLEVGRTESYLLELFLVLVIVHDAEA